MTEETTIDANVLYERAFRLSLDYMIKRGSWLSHYDYYCKRKGYIPSGLIAYWWCDMWEQGIEHPINFCPIGGADMRG